MLNGNYLRNNTCRGCKGKMEQTLSMSTRVEDAFGSFTTLEWSEEACEALFECKTQELAENKDIQVDNFYEVQVLAILIFHYFFLFSETGFFEDRKPKLAQSASNRLGGWKAKVHCRGTISTWILLDISNRGRKKVFQSFSEAPLNTTLLHYFLTFFSLLKSFEIPILFLTKNTSRWITGKISKIWLFNKKHL